MPLYRHILQQAMLTSWRHKYLWFFGLFAAMVGSGAFEIVGQSVSSTPSTIEWFQQMSETGLMQSDILANLSNIIATRPMDLFMIGFSFVVLLAAVLFFMWLATVSQVAIVHNTILVIAEKNHSIQTGIDHGIKHFWTAFFLNLLVKITIFGALLIVNLPIIAGVVFNSSITASYSYLLSFVIFVPALILFSFLIKYAIGYAVIKEDGFVLSMKRAYHLFKTNWLVSIETAFLLFLASFVFSVVIIVALTVLYIPTAFVGSMANLAFGSLAAMLVYVSSGLCGLLVIVFAGAFNTTFQISAWTILFTELTGRGGESKIARVWNSFFNK